MAFCTKCGSELAAQAKFCTGCGSKLQVARKAKKTTNPFAVLFLIGFGVLLFYVVPIVSHAQHSTTYDQQEIATASYAVIWPGIPIALGIWFIYLMGRSVMNREA